MKTDCLLDASGECQVTQNVTVEFAGGETEMNFPLGTGATGGSVVGFETEKYEEDGITILKLTNAAGFTGSRTFTITYHLSGLVTKQEDGTQLLTLPLLCPKWAYAISSYDFTVTLPTAVETDPSYVSGYYGDVIEDYMTALSGGVDSAVTAALLLKAGYEVEGATMLLHESGQRELDDARLTADRLGIPFHVYDFREEFRRLVTEPFIETYRSGATPNPCVVCNRTVKFGLFLDRSLALGCSFVATGHYARLARDEKTGRYLVRTALDAAKDQTYMFCMMTAMPSSN